MRVEFLCYAVFGLTVKVFNGQLLRGYLVQFLNPPAGMIEVGEQGNEIFWSINSGAEDEVGAAITVLEQPHGEGFAVKVQCLRLRNSLSMTSEASVWSLAIKVSSAVPAQRLIRDTGCRPKSRKSNVPNYRLV